MDQIFEISNRAVFTFIILALGLFLVFRLITWLLPLVMFKKDKRKHVWRFAAILELIVWIIFLVWSVNFLAESSLIYAIGLVIILFFFTLYTTWVGLKDFIAGALFKTNKTFSLNETVKIGEYSGKIVKFSPTALLLETESGESIFLPYSFLFGKVMVKSHPAETILNHTFRFEIPSTENLSVTMQKIRTEILNMPWASLKKTPQIKPLMETPTGQLLEVTLFSIENEYFPEMENILKGKFGIASRPTK
jgi:hypothetical protein